MIQYINSNTVLYKYKDKEKQRHQGKTWRKQEL